MGPGLSGAWRAMQPGMKRCPRCKLYHAKTLTTCPHCGHLDDAGLQQLLRMKAGEARGNAALGKLFLIAAAIILVLLLVSGM